MARQVLDIFLSSTSEDLREHRRVVADVLSTMGQFVVRMEGFGARPSRPLEVCRDEVRSCDALIVLVGHRYGWVPEVSEGGDGDRSITWHEVQWAMDGGRPVFAFLIDASVPWAGAREQDRLLSATTEPESLQVWRAVRGLAAFRQFLETTTTRAEFRTPDQLGTVVATSVYPWLLQTAAPRRASARVDRVPTTGLVPDDSGRREPGAETAVAAGPEHLYWHEQIHAGSAWELLNSRTLTGPPVRVAIIAGTPRTAHPALAGVTITTVGVDPDMPASADDYTTALAALIGGTGANGFQGVAPGTDLLAISVLGGQSSTTNTAIAEALDRAVLGGARVVCLALGTTERSPVIDDAVCDAVRAGVTIVAAAGNGGDTAPTYPAACDGVVATGAVDRTGTRTPFSSYGAWVQVTAPGEALLLPAGDGYRASSGTSWPCAIVTGAVALMLRADPSLTPSRVALLLHDAAQPGPHPGTEAGLLNVHDAVRAALPRGRSATRT